MTQSDHTANAALVGGWVMWLSAKVAEIMPLFQALSFILAAIASICAIVHYVYKFVRWVRGRQ
jgi:hypothetical protein